MPSLSGFSIDADGETYRLRLTLENGSAFDIAVSPEQLDLLAEEIDRRLDMDLPAPLPDLQGRVGSP
ncbi:hypothetical protein [Sphingobium chungbukense]|nr:hypothetical protein [Sphingobium chungbukense]